MESFRRRSPGLPEWMNRARDRPAQRPAALLHAPDEAPGLAQGLGLAWQQVALQSVYWLLPALAGAAFGLDAAGIMSLVSLALVGCALGVVLQGLTRGPVGSGYGVPNVPTPIFLGAYLLAASSGAGMGTAGAAMILAAIAAMVLFLAVPRLLSLIPSELTGVVVFMIGVSLLPRALELAMRDGVRGMPESHALLLLAAVLLIMVAAATLRWPLARFAVILGGVAGSALALLLVPADPAAAAALAAAPWFGLPVPVPPDFGGVTPGLLLAFLVALVCLLPDWLGDLLTYQRAAHAGWTKPDTAPLRRGILAGMFAVMGAGLIGAFGPSTSSACVGLSVSTRSLSRRVALYGAGLLLLLACSPKLVSLIILLPGPVAAAMIAFVGAFMVASGATLMAARALDVRRTCCAGLGLIGGLAVMVDPALFARHLPAALVSPVTFAFTAAFLLHLLTLPMVTRKAGFAIELGAGMPQAVDRFVEQAAGAWALRLASANAIRNALVEVLEILAGRGLPDAVLQVTAADDVVRVTVQHAGGVLPAPSVTPQAMDLDGDDSAHEAFAMWLAARETVGCTRRARPGGALVELEFQD
ncbi:MAG TPA: solute carrier family 23 protein [Mesorhizobium sp.]|jgi:xanthine/uracil permease|nr:solute carrier family 23 protein [Mesorhizobium sp.]